MDKIKLNLFEKAKQAVAVENGYSDWGQVLRICDYEDVYRMMEEVFEHGCNEAVKADRAETTNEAYYDIHQDDHVVSCKALNRPLPFPQQPDER